MKILVIGGGGFVGAHIVRALIAAGVRPTLFGPTMSADLLADAPARFGVIEGSILSRDDLRQALHASKADLIVNCAGFSAGRLGLMRSGEADADAAMQVNALGLAGLLEVAGAAGVRRVVWTSSTVVYGPSADYPLQPVDETAPVGPTTLYGLTKVMAEQISAYHRKRHGLDVIALRLPLVLGPGLWYNGAAAALTALFGPSPPPVLAFHDEPIDLIHAADVATAVLALLRHQGPLAGIYNLEGFRARASDVLHCIRAHRPGFATRLDAVAPTLLFPLITGARLAADTGFRPAFDLEHFVRTMLETDR